MEQLEFTKMEKRIMDYFESINKTIGFEKYDITKIEKFLEKHEDRIIQLDNALNLGEAYDYDEKRINKRALKDAIEDFINDIKNNNNEIGSILDTVMLKNVINLILNYLLHSDVKQYGFDSCYNFSERPYERYNFVTYSYIATWLYNNENSLYR